MQDSARNLRVCAARYDRSQWRFLFRGRRGQRRRGREVLRLEPRRIDRFLDPDEAALVKRVFDAKPSGNFEEEATGRLTGSNNPAPKEFSFRKLHPSLNSPRRRLRIGWKSAQETIRCEGKRFHPHKDDKILTDWNGLMIAHSRKGQAFDEPKYAEAARKAADFAPRP